MQFASQEDAFIMPGSQPSNAQGAGSGAGRAPAKRNRGQNRALHGNKFSLMQALQMFIFIMPLLMVKDARGFGAPEFDLSRNNMCHQISNAMGQVQMIDRQRIRNELHRFSGRAGTNKKRSY